jgi:hypothetical protein
VSSNSRGDKCNRQSKKRKRKKKKKTKENRLSQDKRAYRAVTGAVALHPWTGQGFQGVNCGVAGNAVAHWASNNTNHNINYPCCLLRITRNLLLQSKDPGVLLLKTFFNGDKKSLS